MWNLKYDTNELIYRTDSQTQRTDLWLPRGRVLGEGCIGSLGLADINYYMYVKLNQFAVHQKLTQHCKSTILQFKKILNIYVLHNRASKYMKQDLMELKE